MYCLPWLCVNEVNLSKYQLPMRMHRNRLHCFHAAGKVDLSSADTPHRRHPFLQCGDGSDHVSVDQQSERHGGGYLELPGCHRRALSRGTIHAFWCRDQRAQPHRPSELQISPQTVGHLNYAFAVRLGKTICSRRCNRP